MQINKEQTINNKNKIETPAIVPAIAAGVNPVSSSLHFSASVPSAHSQICTNEKWKMKN